ncbi:MAG: aromatic ring-hydroxylating dioxygenase subunit alpha [Acidobacteriota bacterium]
MSELIASQIEKAATLPSAYYTDEELFRRSIERIFARSWQFIGDTSQIKMPGAVQPFTLLEGSLEEPLLLTRDWDDKVHLMSNVCTHRGYLVAEQAGCERHLRCRYHGRRFSLDGRLKSMPEFSNVEGFPAPQDDLPQVPFDRWGKFLFAGLAPTHALDELLEDVKYRLGWLPLDEFAFDPHGTRDYLVKANWALYCDNYLEGFHIPFVHSSLDAALDYGSYRTEIFSWSNLQLGEAQGDVETFDLPPEAPDYGRPIGAFYYFLFPNTMLNFYPWGLSVNVVKPLSIDRTRVSFISYLWDESKVETSAGNQIDRVEREDEVVVEGVQRGVRSRLYDRGRYSPKREAGVHHFHRLIAAALNGEGP